MELSAFRSQPALGRDASIVMLPRARADGIVRPRRETCTVLRQLLPALLLPLLFTAPAQAVLIDSGDGTGNTTAPADDPGFGHVGKKSTLSVIYVGYGWVLSAAHVGLGDVVLGGVTYPALSGSRIVLIHSGTTQADLELFRIDPAPSLPPLPIRASEPAVDDPVIMIGNGRNRGDALSVFRPSKVYDGYYWQAGRAMRWGTNVVDSIEPDLDTGSRVTDSFATSFSRSGTLDECQAANGDSSPFSAFSRASPAISFWALSISPSSTAPTSASARSGVLAIRVSSR